MTGASIVVLTHNRAVILKKSIPAMLKLDYPGEYEVIIVNDGSKDNTKEALSKFKNSSKIRIINQERQGTCKSRNNGMRAAKYPIVVTMDDDCLPAKDWLTRLVKGFDNPNVAMVSSYAEFGGTSTAWKKNALEEVGFYDEDYFYYREDTDLVFRLLDAGYTTKIVRADYIHDHKLEKPKTLAAFIKHVIERAGYHKNDVLLYKKHHVRAKKFLKVRLGFLVNPMDDFNRATGRWQGNLNLSSPRGITFLENKSAMHMLAIILGGMAYVALVKAVRLLASFRFKKLLI